MISALDSPIWVRYQGCNLDSMSSYLVASQKQKHFIPRRGHLSTRSRRGGVSAVILQDTGCENENLSPCCCDLCHRKTPGLVPRPLLERPQHCCPARCRDCALPEKQKNACGQHIQSWPNAIWCVMAARSEAWGAYARTRARARVCVDDSPSMCVLMILLVQVIILAQ